MKFGAGYACYRSGRLAGRIVERVVSSDAHWPFLRVETQDPEHLRKVVEDASTRLGYNVIPAPGKLLEPIQSMPYDSLAGHDGELRQLINNNRRSIYFCSDLSAISPRLLYWLAYHFCEVVEPPVADKNIVLQNPIFVCGSIMGGNSEEALTKLSHFSCPACALVGLTQAVSVIEFKEYCRVAFANCVNSFSLVEMTRDLPKAMARYADVDKEGCVYHYSTGNDCSILHVTSRDFNDRIDCGIECQGVFIPLGYRSVLRTFMDPADDVESLEYTLAEQLEYMGRILAKYGQHLFDTANIDALMKIHADQVTSTSEWLLSQKSV